MAEPRDIFDSHPDLVDLDAWDGGRFADTADFMRHATPEQALETLRRIRENKRRRRGGSS